MTVYVFQDLKDYKIYSSSDPLIPHLAATYPQDFYLLLVSDSENLQRDIAESEIMGSVLPRTRRSSGNEGDL